MESVFDVSDCSSDEQTMLMMKEDVDHKRSQATMGHSCLPREDKCKDIVPALT